MGGGGGGRRAGLLVVGRRFATVDLPFLEVLASVAGQAVACLSGCCTSRAPTVGSAAGAGDAKRARHPEQPVAKVPAAFERRCIPPDCVVRRLHMPNMRHPHALSGGRLAALGATRGFTTGCEGEEKTVNPRTPSRRSPRLSARRVR